MKSLHLPVLLLHCQRLCGPLLSNPNAVSCCMHLFVALGKSFDLRRIILSMAINTAASILCSSPFPSAGIQGEKYPRSVKSCRFSPLPASAKTLPQWVARKIHVSATISSDIITSLAEASSQDIPGDYGLPILGPILDRIDYHELGAEGFVKKRVEAYNSTVFRVNMPPGPPGFPDSRAIVLADQKSFRVLFDVEKVEKKDLFTGAYMPSPAFTGGFRVLSYLDTIEDRDAHSRLKKFCFQILSSNGKKWMPEFEEAINEAFLVWEKQIQEAGKADFSDVASDFVFNFLARSVLSKDARLEDATKLINTWLLPQLLPLLKLGLPRFIEEIFLHSFPLPYFLVAKQYQKITDFFEKYGSRTLDMAEKDVGLDRKEALHNLIFFICFNTHGGLVRLFPSLLRYIGSAGPELQRQLREEIRGAVESNGGKISMAAMQNMPLLNSTVYEVLRIAPPVQFQCGRARSDITINSHTASFKVKKGEFLAGFQPFATRDPLIFENPDQFIADRFLGDEGSKKLDFLLWSNGPETSSPSVDNKQCAGKDFVVFISRLFVAHIFLRYDSFALGQPLVKGSIVKFNFSKLQTRASH